METGNLLESGNIIELLSLLGTILVIVAVIILAIKTFLGGKRSNKNAIARLIGNVGAGVAAIFLTPLLVNLFSKDGISTAVRYLPEDLQNNETLVAIMASLTKALASIALYAIFYLVFALIALIIVSIAAVSMKTDEESKVVSYIVSGVSCLITLFLLLSPVFSLTYSLSADVSVIIETKSNNGIVKLALDAVIEEYSDNVPPEKLKALADKRNGFNSFIYDHVTGFTYAEGKKINVHGAVYGLCSAVSDILADAPKDLDVTDFELTPANVEFLRLVKNRFFESDFLKIVFTEITHDSCTAWYNGDTYCGIVDPFADSNYKQNSKKLYGMLMDADDKGIDEAFDYAAEQAALRD